jgi:hypothetical protein
MNTSNYWKQGTVTKGLIESDRTFFVKSIGMIRYTLIRSAYDFEECPLKNQCFSVSEYNNWKSKVERFIHEEDYRRKDES